MRGLSQLDVEPMLDLVLVIEPACGCLCGRKGREENAGGRAEGGELACPGGGIAGDEVGELGWGLATSGGRGAAGDGVHASYSRIRNKAGEDMGALSVMRLSSGSSLSMCVWEVSGRVDTYHHTRTTDQCDIHHVCVSEVVIRVKVCCVCIA